MSDDAAEVPSAAAQIRQWMTGVLRKTGWSGAEWAKKAGLAPSTVQRAIKPDYEFVTSSRTLTKLALVANVGPPELTDVNAVNSGRVHPLYLPLRYKVQAGHWVEMDEYAQNLPAEFPVAPDKRYSGFPQWLEQVVGDSIDQKIAPGGYAHVVDAISLGYAPRQGDFVVVERRRDGLRERSIKQIVVTPTGVELWPRSTNSRWSTPLSLTAGAKGEVEVEVVGLVVGAYARF